MEKVKQEKEEDFDSSEKEDYELVGRIGPGGIIYQPAPKITKV